MHPACVAVQNGTVNLPYNTYLHDSRVTVYGGVLQGIHTLNISLDGVFTIYPPARRNTSHGSLVSKELHLNSIIILDGGRFEFTGTTEDRDKLDIVLGGGLVVQGGGVMSGNYLNISGKEMTFVLALTFVLIKFVVDIPEFRSFFFFTWSFHRGFSAEL